jgi:KDO2-lipid IV(A) lauroyltransferase
MIFENYYLYRLAHCLITRLPRGLVYFCAGLFAEINFNFNRVARRGVYANQARVLPPETGAFVRWRMARSAFRHFAYAIVDFFFIPDLTPENLKHHIADIRGLEYLEAAQQAGSGGIFVTVHMGSWELAGAAMGLMGLPLTVVALPHKDPRVDKIFHNTRTAGKMEVVPIGGAMKRLVDALRRGRFIGLVSDRDVKGTGLRLPFFGQPASMPDGHARLALSTGAWIFPGATYRVKDHRIVLDILPPIIPDPQKDTVESLTRRALAVLEDVIRSHPDQWLSFFNLWSETQLPVASQHRA